MGTILPALSLALVHIAGDNAGVVPDAAALAGANIYMVIIIAYMVFGSFIAGLCAWIGARSGLELGVLVRRRFGCRGKNLLAVAVLVISIPASALTGGYFCGWLIHGLTGVPHYLAVLICLTVFSLLASGRYDELLAASGYCSLLFVPMVLLLLLGGGMTTTVPVVGAGKIDWLLVMALVGYNSGGMRPILVTEAAAYLARKGRHAVWLAVTAKMVEGVITLMMAQVVITAGTRGTLALSAAAENLLGSLGGILFDCSLFCVFLNTMVPAMMVNARQTASLTGLGFWPSLTAAGIVVYLFTWLDYNSILYTMSGAGFLMIGMILYTAVSLFKQNSIPCFQKQRTVIENPEN